MHEPVMLDRCVELLSPAITAAAAAGRRPVFVDATLGLGGHTEAMLLAHGDLTAVGIDTDPSALKRAAARLQPLGDRNRCVHTTFDQFDEALDSLGLEQVDAVLFDLGVSSMQLDEAERGFAYSYDAPLDMRMDTTGGPTAADVLATYDADRLARVLYEYGDERYARRIAAEVVRVRETEPLRTSADLVALLQRTIPARSQRTGGHPAKRTFQALRVEVNDELGRIRRALPAAMERLVPAGRLVVMSYQSLEDRIVKRTFASATTASVPPGLPVIPRDARPRFRLLTRGAELASAPEIARNPRSAPVRLRAVERLRETP